MTSLLVMLLLAGTMAPRADAQTKPTREDRKAAAEQFNAAHGHQWTIRWDDRRGTPRSILGHKLTQYSGTPQQIVHAFLTDQKQMFGLENVAQDLRPGKTLNSRHGSTYLFFRQYYEGLPVFNGGYVLAIGMDPDAPVIAVQRGTPRPEALRFDPTKEYAFEEPDFTRPSNDWYLHFVNGDYFPDIKVSTNPALTADDARSLALQTAPDLASLADPQLAVYVDEGEEDLKYLLVYDVEGRTNSGAPWYALIDAHSGAVVSQGTGASGIGHVHEMVAAAEPQAPSAFLPLARPGEGKDGPLGALTMATTTAKADVYETNQDHESGLTEKTLGRLTYNGTPADVRLDGTWIKVLRYGGGNDEAEPTSTSPLEFMFTDTDPEFDEVMAYYHANDFRYWVYYMGMPWSHVSKTTINVDHPSQYAVANPPSTINFMEEESSNGWLNPSSIKFCGTAVEMMKRSQRVPRPWSSCLPIQTQNSTR